MLDLLPIFGYQHVRCANLARKVVASSSPCPKSTKKLVKQPVKQLVKRVKPNMDMKSALSRQLSRRRDLASQRKPMCELQSNKETISNGRKEIVIEPSCSENPAFTPDKDEDVELQVSSFSPLGLREDVLKALHNINVTKPTVIQMVTIPPLLKREHVLCAAQTGTGKTLAYLAPVVHHLREDERKLGVITRLKRPRACIVVPGRELAIQVLEVAKSLSHHARFKSVGIIGGRKKKFMKKDLASPVDLVVATPGTLLQFREKDRLFFSDLSYLVIDEADSMFDSTFKSDTMEILQSISIRQGKLSPPGEQPVDTQVTIVGATMPNELVVDTLQRMLPRLKICSSGLHRVLPHIRHRFVKVKQEEKAGKLLRLLRHDLQDPFQRTIVFCNTTEACDFVGHFLTEKRIKFIRLHKVLPSKVRSNLFEEFQEGRARVLVCTDIASRGVDPDVSHVINFDFPTSIVDYIHRVGRTGRVKTETTSTGVSAATSLLTHNRDVRMAKIIEQAAKKQRRLEGIEIRPKRPTAEPGPRENWENKEINFKKLDDEDFDEDDVEFT
ncbi:DEAD-box ATP-dependent RNA helicase 39 [Stylophora pistillata]|uniref:RNA helicase n=2 Tax=Stylophora pistillata TaxID=50429 RepID=A0A2B4RQ47_STYPI|nr:DEAD-box ATP-dependent RNA helicase 39 [Stylophora pistillata]